MADTVFLMRESEASDSLESDGEINSGFDGDSDAFMDPVTFSPRDRQMSIENTTLTEIITIYEKLKKGRETRVFMKSKFDIPSSPNFDMGLAEVAETIPMVPTFNPIGTTNERSPTSILDFSKFKNLKHTKYIYYSEKTSLIQSDFIETLGNRARELLKAKNYWLNIFDPDEEDYSILHNSYGVHDLTIMDIKEGYTEEKLEVFQHYTFVSMRLLSEHKSVTGSEDKEDVDFNILLFNDFVVTIHGKQWPSINDILGFLNLVTNNSKTSLTPELVLFSIFIEMNQDAKYIMKLIEPKIDGIRVSNRSVDIMKRNFGLELEVYTIQLFIKPKMKILRQLKQKCYKRMNRNVMRLLGDILEDLGEGLLDLRQYNLILERSQDTFLALISSDHARTSNQLNMMMRRIAEIAVIFVPFNLIAIFMGTNVQIPFQNSVNPNEICFFGLLGLSAFLGASLFILRKKLFGYR